MTATTVTLPYNHHTLDDNGPLNWAKDHCPSYITNGVESIYGDGDKRKPPTGFVVKYYFSEEADAVVFALRWS